MDSSKDQKNNEGEKQFSIQPIKDKVEPELAAHKAHGPAIVQNLPGEEGTKEERSERKTELNK
ncbi:hypothetical protein LLEC1_06157 [Akanthomyces lecanii]|uniref:Uncharacterized protein n=1 Tax=Cordyceps confragosa TaxID=2714763 RepID=A0A179IJF0_CORDF|nr:hypothetical protein LLEC1_06157 [Akanthomyces lecanii]